MAQENSPSGGEPLVCPPQIDRSTKPTNNGETVSIRMEIEGGSYELNDSKWLEPPDKYRWLIRDILRSNSHHQLLSGRSSISSNCSGPNSGPATSTSQLTTTSATTSLASSESIRCELDLPTNNNDNDDTNVLSTTHLFAESTSVSPSPVSTRRKPSQLRKFSYSVYDYSHRISRYIKWLDLLVMIITFFIVLALLVIFKLDPLTGSSLCLFAFLWFSFFILYLLVPTFKHWFLYWNPDFSITKPT